MTSSDKYSARVFWSEKDAMFVAVCPELGELSALGPSRDEAISELHTAIELALQVYEEDGEVPPEPRSSESYSGQFRLRVPRSLHAWLAEEAERDGVSLNYFVTSILSRARGLRDVQAHPTGAWRLAEFIQHKADTTVRIVTLKGGDPWRVAGVNWQGARTTATDLEYSTPLLPKVPRRVVVDDASSDLLILTK